MEWQSLLDERPVVVAIAGSNGAGKSTFFQAHLAAAGLRLIAADDLAAELGLGAYEAADLAASLRVMQGGHDVPDEKLVARFGRTLANLERAIQSLPVVIVFDNTDLSHPYRLEAVYRHGARVGPG